MARPPTGAGHYLRDLVYGALDGVVTTLAVVAGVAGADLAVGVALILGLANLVADGISMGASNYLGLKSELEQQDADVAAEKPLRHGLATLAAFVAAGAVPLVAFLLPVAGEAGRLPVAAALSALTLFAVGALRSRFLPRGPLRAGGEMLAVGMVAGAAAYGVGLLLRGLSGAG